MTNFVGGIVLFEAPSNARSTGFVEMNEYELMAVRQDHVGFVEQPSENCDDYLNLISFHKGNLAVRRSPRMFSAGSELNT